MKSGVRTSSPRGKLRAGIFINSAQLKRKHGSLSCLMTRSFSNIQLLLLRRPRPSPARAAPLFEFDFYLIFTKLGEKFRGNSAQLIIISRAASYY
jgi:hypothetical protein